MNIIRVVEPKEFPLKWANFNNYPESKAYKKEVYLKEFDNIVNGLIELFYNLFDNYKTNLYVYNDSWWDFTLDTWDFQNNTHDYSLDNKSKEVIDYLSMLKNSGIEKGYSGVCDCLNWTNFLQIILPCIVSHQAIYSPIFYNAKENFFFYFHHTGSIGLYYEKESNAILNILNLANKKYLIE